MEIGPIEAVLGGLATIGIVGLMWCLWSQGTINHKQQLPDHLPKGLTFKSQPLLTKDQATFYNLLRLAVEDQYLVFAQVPLWSLVSVFAKEPQDIGMATSFMNRISKQRIDFVLIHPGTLSPAKVIEFEKGEMGSESRALRAQLVQQVFEATGIECIRLDAQQAFTVQSLAHIVEGKQAEP